MKIYVPCDTAAVAVGADAVARAIEQQIAARRIDAQVVRNGSRGLFWLEPLVEVETPARPRGLRSGGRRVCGGDV